MRSSDEATAGSDFHIYFDAHYERVQDASEGDTTTIALLDM